MSRRAPLPLVLVALLACASVRGELPLPDATFFGQLKTPGGEAVGSGALSARIERGASVVLMVPGAFVAADGEAWYVVRVPLETSIGAPGPSGVGAHEGDQLGALVLEGKEVSLKSAAPALKAGLITRIDGTAEKPAEGLVFFRGDCSPDLQLSITDAVRVLNYLFISPEEPPCLSACDSDGSGALNITDGVYLLAYLFLGGPEPPAPGPQCGVDSSGSELGCAQTNCAV